MSDQKILDQEPPIQGARLLKRAIEQFRQLESVGVERDVAGNRKLLYSHYAGLVLLSLFNPAMQSVRGLTDASKLRKVQKLIGNLFGNISSRSGARNRCWRAFQRLLKNDTQMLRIEHAHRLTERSR